MASRRRLQLSEQLDGAIERAVRRLQLRCFQALTSSTPVDTGFARAGWSPSAGAAAPGPDLPGSAADAARSQAAALFQRHTAAANALATGYRLSQGPVFIVNNVRYIVYLNQGTSAQAPAMFVEQAIARAMAETRRELS